MEALEGAMVYLGALPPPRHHSPAEIDITLGHLRRAEEVCLSVARQYGNHCMKVAWAMTLASLDKAGYAHMDDIATRSIVVATAVEIATAQCRSWKVSNVLL